VSRARKNTDIARLRKLCALRPALSYTEIALQLGVSRAAIGYLVRRYRIVKPPVEGGPRWGICPISRPMPTPTRWRCARCGGQRDAVHAHACRPAEPLSMGLQWERRA
jgi:hypothetical protein